MQTYKIKYNKAALKFLDKQDKKQRLRIYKAIYQLPNNGDIKRLKGYNNKYRLRVGDFRIIYDKFDNELIISIINIDNRGQAYNQL